MGKWKRRIRGALGMGVAFGAAWFGAGLLMMLLFLLTTGSTGADVPYPVAFGALGFAAGVLFSLVLSFGEGQRRLEQMSLPRFAAWGTAGGVLLSALFVSAVTLVDDPGFIRNLPILASVFGASGGICAAGALALARRGGERSLAEPDSPASRDVHAPGGTAALARAPVPDLQQADRNAEHSPRGGLTSRLEA